MRIQNFQVSLVNNTRKQLPRSLRGFDARSFFSIVKLSYKQPRVHYEVWVRGKERLVEIGLHFEADKATNDALRAYFDSRAPEVLNELGPRVEIEQWTNSWSRVHEVVPYRELDEALVEQLAEKLARMMTVLQPMVDEYNNARRNGRGSKTVIGESSKPSIRNARAVRSRAPK